MGFWGGMGGGGWQGGGGGHWGGGGGNWGNQGQRGQQGLRRSVDAWDDQELGAAYNHQVVMRLVGYVRPYLFRAALGLIGVIGYAVMLNISPRIIGNAADAAVAGDTSKVTENGLIFLGLAIGVWFFYHVNLLNAGYIGHKVLYRLRTELFSHLQKLSLRFYDNNETGRVMSRVQNDVTSMQELLAQGTLTIIGDILGLFVVIYIVTDANLELALVTFSVVPILIIATAIWQVYARRAFMRVRQAIAIVNSNLQENVSGVRVIQSLSREDVNAERFSAINADNMRANIQAGRLQAAVMPMVEILSASATALVILYGGSQALNGNIAIGDLFVFLFAIELFFQPIRAARDAVRNAPAGDGGRRARLRGARYGAGDRRRAGGRRTRGRPRRGRVPARGLRLRGGRAGPARH